MILFLLLCALVLFIVASWIYFLRDVRKYNVSGPTPYPIIGNGNLFLCDSNKFLGILSDLAIEYKDAYRIYIMSDRYFVLSHPKYIEQLISSTEIITKGISYDFLRPWLGDGLLTSTGPKWRSHRKFLTPAFHYNILHTFLPVFLKNGNILCDTLKKKADGSSIELFPVMAMAALDNITETIMGVSLDAQKEKDSKYVKSIDDISQIMATRMRDVFMGNNFFFSLTPHKRKHDKAIEFMTRHTKEVIEARRKELNAANAKKLVESSELGMKNKHAFLDLLLLAEVDGKQISDDCVRDEVLTFMFEGHDTTASGTVYGLYCIANHPEVQRKILEEQKEVLGGDLKRDPTFSELQQLKYLECVIKESLRLYPSVPMIQRMVPKDVEMAGLRFPKDTTVMINIFRMHRNPDVFEDPLEFRPERFETSNSARNAFSWIAFSAGPRNCIGQKFAMLEMKVTLAAIVRSFELSPCGDEPEPCGDLILRSRNGVHVKMMPRN
uniref:CYP4L46 n=1 Tax=Cydia pomonella TaxID=82600 RepID=A0A8D4TAW5_CYDPO|nr:CYP4L46 [Cydia pomonella]